MNMDFEKVRKLLPEQPFANDITSFIVFGSSVVNSVTGNAPQDVDVCVVVRERFADLQSITEFVFKCFPGPDYRIYFLDELESGLPFMDKGVGVFAMEYFADGISLLGKNIFVDLLKKIEPSKLKESYLNKVFEYVIRIREVKYSLAYDGKYKMWHIQKYLVRLVIDVLLHDGILAYADLKNKTKHDLMSLIAKAGLLKSSEHINFDSSSSLYAAFDEINMNLVKRYSN